MISAMFFNSEKFYLFSYFVLLIIVGAILLYLPGMWSGIEKIKIVDALFTSTSAVCVTGLITLDTAQFTVIGKIVILLLIQFGGLGIISFSTIYLSFPKRKRSFHSVNIIRGYYLDEIGHDAIVIIRNIIFFTLFFELVGAGLLMLFMKNSNDGNFLNALFHSVSAFCNAGFSLFSNNLENQKNNIPLLITIMLLIIAGGLGFVVINDIVKKLRKHKRLSIYSKIMLTSTGILIIGGAFIYLLLERNNSFSDMTGSQKIINAVFQSVTTRTAGFNTVPQQSMAHGSRVLTLPLMFIGGGSGSIAGGIKVSTITIIFIALFRGKNRNNQLRIGNRNISSGVIMNAFILAGKALLLLFTAIIALLIAEGKTFNVISVVFECFSAFGTVGLSHGITPSLGIAGKLILIMTMFAGRVGIVSMAMPSERNFKDVYVQYPEEEVLLG
jgi:trk system potassium uptake protein